MVKQTCYKKIELDGGEGSEGGVWGVWGIGGKERRTVHHDCTV